MAAPSELEEAAVRQRKLLDDLNRTVSDQLNEVARRLLADGMAEIDRITAKMDAQVPGSPAWQYQLDRVMALNDRLLGLVQRYATEVGVRLPPALAEATAWGASDADAWIRMLEEQGPPAGEGGVAAGFTRPPMEAAALASAYATAPGSPLAELLYDLGEQTWDLARLLTAGMLQGKSPRDVARAFLRRAFQGTHARALRIARTEMLRAYREAARDTYRHNPTVTKWQWVSAKRPGRTCAACWALNGRQFPLDQPMEAHPNCLCVMIPVTETWEDQGLEGVPETRALEQPGHLGFARLSPEERRRILGPKLAELYEAGDLKLGDMVTHVPNAKWGGMYRQATVGEALDRVAARQGKEARKPRRKPAVGIDLDGYRRRLREPGLPARQRVELTTELGGEVDAEVRRRIGDPPPKPSDADVKLARERYHTASYELQVVADQIKLNDTLGILGDDFLAHMRRQGVDVEDLLAEYRGWRLNHPNKGLGLDEWLENEWTRRDVSPLLPGTIARQIHDRYREASDHYWLIGLGTMDTADLRARPDYARAQRRYDEAWNTLDDLQFRAKGNLPLDYQLRYRDAVRAVYGELGVELGWPPTSELPKLHGYGGESGELRERMANIGVASGQRTAAARAVEHALGWYPRSWVEALFNPRVALKRSLGRDTAGVRTGPGLLELKNEGRGVHQGTHVYAKINVGRRRSELPGDPQHAHVALHELGHHYEGLFPEIWEQGRAFREMRAERSAQIDPALGKRTSLQKLRPRYGYGSDEVAIPDHFPDPYSGKVYSHGNTEVFTTSIESVFGYSNYADPEMTHWLLGLLLMLP